MLLVLANTSRYALAFSTEASLGLECLHLLLPWFLTEQGLALPAVPYNSLECLGYLCIGGLHVCNISMYGDSLPVGSNSTSPGTTMPLLWTAVPAAI